MASSLNYRLNHRLIFLLLRANFLLNSKVDITIVCLSHTPVFHEPFYTPTSAFNPFSPSTVRGSDSIEANTPNEPIRAPIEGIYAPQGRVPVSVSSTVPPDVSCGSSRPDFIRGSGLDIPEEEEPQEEVLIDTDHNVVDELSRLHSRHVSRLKLAALSLRSVGGITEGVMSEVNMVPIWSPAGNPGIDDLDEELEVGEWTGLEDMYPDREQSNDEGKH